MIRIILALALLAHSALAISIANPQKAHLKMSQTWDKTFSKDTSVEHIKVAFKNRFGITLAGDLYLPKNIDKNTKLKALAISGPFGAVKEQSSGLYAQELAKMGFVALAFDPSFTGESGDSGVRNIASPDINTEDFSAAIDFLGIQSFVDKEKIGIVGICGFGGMGINALSRDSRIKAFVGISLYDMSRSIGHGIGNGKDLYTQKDRDAILKYLNNARYKDVFSNSFAGGLHEIFVDKDGVPHAESKTLLPEVLPENPNPVLKQFFDYYRTKRGFHPRSINSNGIWNATMPLSFMTLKMDSYASTITAPVLLVAGKNAHSLYFSKDIFTKLKGKNKQLLIIDNAHHVDLYDQKDKIPFEKIKDFLNTHLESSK